MQARVIHGLLPLVGRLLISAIFVNATLGKAFGWSEQAAYMASHGMRMVAPLLAIALAIEALGTVCLITGYRARIASFIMFLYLGAVSVMLHDFWSYAGDRAGMMETHFLKNLGIMGGLLMISAYGPGIWSLRRNPRSQTFSTTA